MFEWAAVNRPIVLFLDEIDSIGSRKQVQGSGTDSGGGGREFNLVATQLMQSIDQYRQMDGLLIMAATNYLDGLEPTLDPGRPIRREAAPRPAERRRPESDSRGATYGSFFRSVRDLSEIARRTPGWSPARLKGPGRAGGAAQPRAMSSKNNI